MSWEAVDPAIRAMAARVCTPPQLEALKLWEDGLGYRRIASKIGISTSSARDRIHRALAAIELGLEKTA
jgi:DNA-directed RNA polymerase specialized sigma24 family protein